MLKKWRLKKGDRVVVTTGKDKGKIGEIIQVIKSLDKVVVKDINIVTKHQRPSASTTGGLIRKEAPIHVSNTMFADTNGKPTRIGVKILENGQKVRYAKRSGEIIDK